MYSITICIPTYKRPLMLEKLVLSINESNFDESLIKDIHIIIVDNDVEKTAEEITNELIDRFYGKTKIEYSCFPIKGISNVRNELLRKAYILEPDYVVFIDDDEYVTSEWLNELVKTIISNDAEAARGPVLAKFDETIPDYISCWFEIENYVNNFQLDTLYTGNLILNRLSLQKYNIWFDNRFNLTGSGDVYFGLQLLKKGARIFWAANAIVYETIPESRANINWKMKRNYRGASTYVYILKLENKIGKLIKKIFISLMYIIVGLVGIFFLILPIKKKFWGVLTLVEGIGGLAGLFNILYKEYK